MIGINFKNDLFNRIECLFGISQFILDKNTIVAFDIFENMSIFAGIFILSIIVGLVSGSYPAFYLSSFQPISVDVRHWTLKTNAQHPQRPKRVGRDTPRVNNSTSLIH
jgi:hypothetical protein